MSEAVTSNAESSREDAIQAARLFSGKDDPSFDANTLYYLVCRKLAKKGSNIFTYSLERTRVLDQLAPHLDLFATFVPPPASVTPPRQFIQSNNAMNKLLERDTAVRMMSRDTNGRVGFKRLALDNTLFASCSRTEMLSAITVGVATGKLVAGNDVRIGIDEDGVVFGIVEFALLTEGTESNFHRLREALQLNEHDLAQIVERFESRFVYSEASGTDVDLDSPLLPGHEASSHLAGIAYQISGTAVHGGRPSDSLWRKLLGAMNPGHPERNALLGGLLDAVFLQSDELEPPNLSVVEALLQQGSSSEHLLEHACQCCCVDSVRLALRYDTSIDSDKLAAALERCQAWGTDLDVERRAIFLLLSTAIAQRKALEVVDGFRKAPSQSKTHTQSLP